jgi:hypothetical protein
MVEIQSKGNGGNLYWSDICGNVSEYKQTYNCYNIMNDIINVHNHNIKLSNNMKKEFIKM